jgi:hypothetical protein
VPRWRNCVSPSQPSAFDTDAGMKRLSKWIVLLGMLAAAAASGAIIDTPPPPEIEIVRADFGVFDLCESEERSFVPTTIVPYQEDQKYGWIMYLRTTKPKVKWREELTLPHSPDTWQVGDVPGHNSISADGRTSITENEEELGASGVILNIWQVVHGDPKGRYVIHVFIEDRLERAFEFDVQ